MALTKATFSMIEQGFANPLDYGAVGDGTTNDSAALTAAIATGLDVYIPLGFTFATNGDITGFVDNQRIFGSGTLKKIGPNTTRSIFLLPDLIENIVFDGITLDGNIALYAPSNLISGIFGSVTRSITVKNCSFVGFGDCGIKLRDGARVLVDGCSFYNINTNAIEVRLYTNDPRTGLPYPVRPENRDYRIINSFFSTIDDGLQGAGEGCGVAISSTSGIYFIENAVVSNNTFEDVLRSIWSENNVAGGEIRNFSIIGNTIVGNIAGSATVETKDGIGIIDGFNVSIVGNTVRNVGNFAPPGGTCACVQLSGTTCYDISIVGNTFVDDTGNADRTDYCVYMNVTEKVLIRNNTMTGASVSQIGFNGAPVTLIADGNIGAEGEYSWGSPTPYVFQRTNVPASAALTPAYPGNQTEWDEIPAPCRGAVVGLSVLLSTPITAGNITFKAYTNGIHRANLDITQADFAGGVSFAKAISVTDADAVAIAGGQRLRVYITTDGSFAPTTLDALVVVTFDTSVKYGS
jgi:hypothetical protein